MMPTPTPHLRFVVRQIIDRDNSKFGRVEHKPTRILQQFWSHPDGKYAVGDMFNMQRGTWRDIEEVTE